VGNGNLRYASVRFLFFCFFLQGRRSNLHQNKGAQVLEILSRHVDNKWLFSSSQSRNTLGGGFKILNCNDREDKKINGCVAFFGCRWAACFVCEPSGSSSCAFRPIAPTARNMCAWPCFGASEGSLAQSPRRSKNLDSGRCCQTLRARLMRAPVPEFGDTSPFYCAVLLATLSNSHLTLDSGHKPSMLSIVLKHELQGL